jgi:hypothetical protein
MTARGRRRLGRALVFIGSALWVPELFIAWTLIETLLTPIRGPNGQAAQIHIHLNPSAWVVGVLWTVVCWALVGWGVRILLRNRVKSSQSQVLSN